MKRHPDCPQCKIALRIAPDGPGWECRQCRTWWAPDHPQLEKPEAESNIIGLVPRKPEEPGSEVLIAWLEERLEAARRGEVRGMVGAQLERDYEATYFLVGYIGGFAMQGALQIASDILSDDNRGF